MAFSTRRGRPRAAQPPSATDPGTPELRLKHALGLTAEPIDFCLARRLITEEHHWCGLHLRWLYTLRYGAPSLTTRYTDIATSGTCEESSTAWRIMREQEYNDASALLKEHRHYEPVMRLCIFNELPAFLNHRLQQESIKNKALSGQLVQSHTTLIHGLDILAKHWGRIKSTNRIT